MDFGHAAVLYIFMIFVHVVISYVFQSHNALIYMHIGSDTSFLEFADVYNHKMFRVLNVSFHLRSKYRI